MKFDRAIKLMAELRAKNICYNLTILDNGDAEFFVCTKKDNLNQESLQHLKQFIIENNLSISEQGKEYLISQNIS